MSNVSIFLLGVATAIFGFALIMKKTGNANTGRSWADNMADTENVVRKTPLEEVKEIGNANTQAIQENTEAVREQTALLRQLLEKQNQANP